MAAPVADFGGLPLIGNLPLSTTFTDLSTNVPTSWSRDFGDGSPLDTTQNPVHIYSVAWVYTVALTATNVDGSDTETKTNYIIAWIPIADFHSDDQTVDTWVLVTFTDDSTNTPTSWIWTFWDGWGSTAQNPTHTYLTSWNKNVTLKATNAFGNDTEIKLWYEVVSKWPITADFMSPDTAISQWDFAQFYDLSAWDAITRDWNFWDWTAHVFTQSPSHQFNTAWTFTVTLIAWDGVWTDTETKIDYIVVGSMAPVADFDANPYGWFYPCDIDFTDLSTNTPDTRDWDFWDGTTPHGTDQNPTHTYTATWSYTVTLIALPRHHRPW